MINPLSPSWLSVPADSNAFHPGVWPGSAERNDAGELVIGGVSAKALVESYGSPLYVMDQSELEERAARFLDIVERACALHNVTGSVYYASKALISGHVVAWVSQQGLGFMWPAVERWLLRSPVVL